MSRKFDIGAAPHIPAKASVANVMSQVLYALLPGIIAHCWFFGPGILLQIALAVLFALGFEAAMLKIRKQPLRQHLQDYSAVVTAVLFALCLPPLVPWWIALLGMFFAIVVAKHLYGGLGHNVFNPAMVGYVVVFISFPQVMTQWLPAAAPGSWSVGLWDSIITVFSGQLPASMQWDAISQATPLDTLRAGINSGLTVDEIRQSPIFGDFGGQGWEWIANWYALGGLWLLWRRVIAWQVPVTMIGSVVLLGLLAYFVDSGSNPVPLQHLFSGALVLGAFFIATDPVSGCTSNRGRLLFGAGVGILTLVIRRWGGYPDGVAFAVLLMNMAAPLIDRYTVPRYYGK
jgi:electron transport complex protein RnfD